MFAVISDCYYCAPCSDRSASGTAPDGRNGPERIRSARGAVNNWSRGGINLSADKHTAGDASSRSAWYHCAATGAVASTRYFLFPVKNFHFRLQFFCSQAMTCWELW